MATILIAGGATGIGREAMRRFRAQGDDVLLADVNATEGAAAAADPGPGRACFVEADLAGEETPKRLVAAALETFDGLDCVFFNAAILAAAPLSDWTREDWRRSLDVNLSAPFFLVQAAAPALRRSGNASVILTASTGALRGHAEMHAYHATKAGLLGLARSLADELGPDGVRVNALLPGFVDTPFNAPFWAAQADPAAAEAALASSIPMRRQGAPADVAGVVTFLASPEARYVTGTQMVVDGGYSAV